MDVADTSLPRSSENHNISTFQGIMRRLRWEDAAAAAPVMQ